MMVYGLNRFSEDLDFTLLQKIDPKKLQSEIGKDLTLLGISAQFGKFQEFEDGFSFRMGIQGPLFRKELDRCYIYVEVSSREKNLLPPFVHSFQPIYPDLLPFNGSILNKDEILAEKFRALCTRKKARDLYDVDFLIKRQTQTTLTQINQKLAFYQQSFNIKTFAERIANFASIWKEELNAFVIGQLSPFEDVLKNVLDYVGKVTP